MLNKAYEKYCTQCLFSFYKSDIHYLQLLVLRSVHNQVNNLLNSEEKSLLEIQNALKPLLSLNPLNYNPYTEALWRASVAQYEDNMVSAKKTVASKLRNQLRSSKSNPLQVC